MANQLKASRRKEVVGDVDRISSLPDSLLHHLLSFLPTEFVVQTCVLSKRWRDVWSFIPFLDFSQIAWSSERSISFSKFIDTVLLLRDGYNVKKLRLYYDPTSRDCSRVDDWIFFAVRRKIECLDIKLPPQGVGGEPFLFTHPLLTCQTLRQLKLDLGFVEIKPVLYLNLSSLETLHLKSIAFREDKLANVLISSCPRLKSLIIEGCLFHVRNKLNISSPLLKNLIVRSNRGRLEINLEAPSLVWLNLPMESLFEACVQRLAEERKFGKCVDFAFDNLKLLELGAGHTDVDYYMIKKLLQSSRNIEVLELQISVISFPEKRLEPELMWRNCRLSCLKFLKLKDFGASENEIKFVKWLLKNAVVLEKITITATTSVEKEELKRVREMLLTYYRASSSVGIYLM